MNFRTLFFTVIFAMASIILLGFLGRFFYLRATPIKIGILHSLTGNLSFSEKPIVDALLMGIEELNRNHSVLQRKIVPIIANGKSDDTVFAQEAQRLLNDEKVAVIFGCWTSSSRKAVLPFVEEHKGLLIYPVSFEGMEESKHVLCTGATQNQQIIPAALWSVQNLGSKFFLVGSESIFSRMTIEIIKTALASTSAQIIGQEFLLVGSQNTEELVNKIKESNADVIINVLHGVTNLSFFKTLRKHGITPEKIPVMTISSVSEVEFAQLGADAMAGDYVTASYFQSIERDENTHFVSNFKKKYGASRVISESEEAAYIGLNIWAQAVNAAQSSQALKVIQHLPNQVFNAPEGIVSIDNHLLNTWKRVYVGKLRNDGQFTIVWDSKQAIEPFLYPIFKTPQEWKQIEINFYESWGKQWTKAS